MRVVPLSDAVVVNPKIDRSQLGDDTPISFVPMAAVGAANGSIDASAIRPYVEVKKGYTHFRENDVLFAKVTPCMENGKMAVARNLKNGIGFGSTEFHVLRPREGVDPHYVYHFVSSQTFRKEAARHMTGAVGLRRVPTAFLESAEIPLPALDVQREIVAELEKQFSRLDEAVANLQRVKANLKRYKATVLQSAIDGVLIRSTSSFSEFPLQELIGRIAQGWSPKCDLNREALPDEWAIITTTAVQPMQYLDNQGKPLPAELVPRPGIEIKNGDFLMTRKGPRKRAGVACLVRATRHRLMVCDTVYRFRCDESKVQPEYLEIALNAPKVVDAIDRHKAGISESGVSLTHDKLGSVLIPLPSREAQAAIVAEVDRHLSIIREVEAEVDANLQRAQALRQSTLAKAFSS